MLLVSVASVAPAQAITELSQYQPQEVADVALFFSTKAFLALDLTMYVLFTHTIISTELVAAFGDMMRM